MAATASTLSALAAELIALGGDVQGACCGCCLPATIEAEVLAGAGGVQSILVDIAGDFGVQASDLAARGAIAANDSLGTAASAASPIYNNWLDTMSAPRSFPGLGASFHPSTGFSGSGGSSGFNGYNLGALATVRPDLDVSYATWHSGNPGGTYGEYAREHPEGDHAERGLYALNGPTAMGVAAQASGNPLLNSVVAGFGGSNI